VQEGVILLAQLSGAPIHPFSFYADRVHRFRSWDGFILPMPFSRGIFVWGKPMRVPRDADPALREIKRLELEKELARVTGLAENHFKKGKDASL
jgi:lysophospholipid acyltransferase (LPLAT)-like uncharacterized protein